MYGCQQLPIMPYLGRLSHKKNFAIASQYKQARILLQKKTQNGNKNKNIVPDSSAVIYTNSE